MLSAPAYELRCSVRWQKRRTLSCKKLQRDDECRLGKKRCVDVTLRSCNLSLLYYNCVYYYRCVAHKPRSLTILGRPRFLQKEKGHAFLSTFVEKSIIWIIAYICIHATRKCFFFLVLTILDVAFFLRSYVRALTWKTRILCAHQHYTFKSYYTRWLLTGLCLFSV